MPFSGKFPPLNIIHHLAGVPFACAAMQVNNNAPYSAHIRRYPGVTGCVINHYTLFGYNKFINGAIVVNWLPFYKGKAYSAEAYQGKRQNSPCFSAGQNV